MIDPSKDDLSKHQKDSEEHGSSHSYEPVAGKSDHQANLAMNDKNPDSTNIDLFSNSAQLIPDTVSITIGPKVPYLPEPYSLSPRQEDRAMEIMAEFIAWNRQTGPCPINISNSHWFKKLAAMAERVAILESVLDNQTAEIDRLKSLCTEAANEIESRIEAHGDNEGYGPQALLNRLRGVQEGGYPR